MAGLLLVASGVLQLVMSAQLTLPVTDTFVIPLAVPPVSFAAALTRAAAFVVLAIGVGGELGLTANSRPGRVALIVWGLRDLVFLVLAALPGTIQEGPQLGVVVIPLEIVLTIAGVTAAVAVVRARVLAGWARWTLLPLATIEAASVLIFDTPVVAELAAAALPFWPTEYLEPVLTLAIAVVLLTWGRMEAVKHRARVIHDAW